ncbi:Hypothetical predicted protein [Podarcis lilfordi]|uniref:Uncharacterized protein n=1 Tax=Podarcis lilfordi TaxID=74358 RepID=A0AA35PP50_9SAUR|nr:Hypothetical predicted protein [Podarcis lilfordi]
MVGVECLAILSSEHGEKAINLRECFAVHGQIEKQQTSWRMWQYCNDGAKGERNRWKGDVFKKTRCAKPKRVLHPRPMGQEASQHRPLTLADTPLFLD